jgi:predicted DsbA family dithiol-disulfide isomerase
MPEKIAFYFDPLCPWCYLTSKWVHRLVELDVVEVDWRLFSLEVHNTKKTSIEDANEFRASTSLRTAVALRDAEGPHSVGRFYAALDTRIWDDTQDIRDDDVVRAAVRDAGFDPAVVDSALADPTTWDRVVAEHDKVVAEVGAFGVPTIRLDGGSGPAIFGPVIHTVPNDDDAVELFHHVSWLVRHPAFWEIKRERTESPDLEHARVRAARRAAAEAEAAASAAT